MMIPIIMNTNFTRLAAIDEYISFIWTSRYYNTGDFELVIPVNAKNINLIKKDFYIIRDDDENVGIIEDIIINRNEDLEETMTVTGRFLQSILGRRIIAPQTNCSGRLSNCIEALVNSCLVNPVISARKINNFIIDSSSFTDKIDTQFTGDNLLETVSEICMVYGVGFKVTMNSSNQFVFKLYKGEDRTYDQDENPWVIFSDQYDNLLSSQYEECYKDISTAVWVAGEGDGLDRKALWVSSGETGLGRYEVYKDERQIQSNGGEIPLSDYNKLLEASGKDSLTKYTTAFTGSVYFDNVKYREDVFLGDLCVIENQRWGIVVNSRLVEVIESVDETGEYSILPTFGI
ncbi:siphovirus ReqiPepy6 Gp37-like family protein [uncultured Methanobrevibacter sp.]|uniref:siphovirus ReqiPepy6 Gp37-like family protein n=1 Tax=uncultured Methanobrevibacter sp. TaxID=253161 RepID=UPI00260CFF76|nr:siphovirus ReqiPepy6 Gp37-like family protein [uncultured Methanobrevibacter sp.]